MKTRNVALTVAVALVLALVTPVLSQPFADVPTNHWAYDAIAELAAKGLVEGYPDGTFKGNQPLSRFEMAMIVARIIARIEAIPTPPPPEVRRADLDAVRREVAATRGEVTAVRTALTATARDVATLMRLVSEFRAELQALGVRVTALEEELHALRARLDNTRITGDFLWWYTGFSGQLSGAPVAPPPRQDLTRVRLTYTGTVAENVSVTLRATYSSLSPPPPPVPPAEALGWDRLHLDWRNAFGLEGLSLRVGRQVITLGPIGLLLDQTGWNLRRDGVSATWRLGGVTVQAGAQWTSATQATTEGVLSGRVAFSLIPGWTLGINARSDLDPWVPANQGAGFSVDLAGELLAGLRLTAEGASYNAPSSPPQRGFFAARLELDFNRLTGAGIPLEPRLTVWYKNLDSVTGTPMAALRGSRGAFGLQDAYWGDWGTSTFFTSTYFSLLAGYSARLDLRLAGDLTAFATYDNYDSKTTPVVNLNVFSVGVAWTVAPRTTLNLFHSSLNIPIILTNLQATGVWVSTSW